MEIQKSFPTHRLLVVTDEKVKALHGENLRKGFELYRNSLQALKDLPDDTLDELL